VEKNFTHYDYVHDRSYTDYPGIGGRSFTTRGRRLCYVL